MMLTTMVGNMILSVHEEVIHLARVLVLGQQQLQKDWCNLQGHQLLQDLLLLPQKLLRLPKQVSIANITSTN